ncbi:hypothetical protein [Parendozoicomonas haliclonae]|uniref:hypothetical protein n=1 Tax=Parendozoicomonas haliclonae TaxID=1960125 RepID=UPI000B3523F4|nr:hypothetical protein [Parendozoicomonas haliclonae]
MPVRTQSGVQRLLTWAVKVDSGTPDATEEELRLKALRLHRQSWGQGHNMEPYKARNWLRELQQLRGLQVMFKSPKMEQEAPLALAKVPRIPLKGTSVVIQRHGDNGIPLEATLHICFKRPRFLQEHMMCTGFAELMHAMPIIQSIHISPFPQWNHRPDEIILNLNHKNPEKIKQLAERCQTIWRGLLSNEMCGWEWAGGGHSLGGGLFLRECTQGQSSTLPPHNYIQSDAKTVSKAVARYRKERGDLKGHLDQVLQPVNNSVEND